MYLFKRKVVLNYVKQLKKDVVMIVGDKFSDSARRRRLLSAKGVIEYNKFWCQLTFHPIAHWTSSNVFEYLALNNIEVNPLYSIIGSSGNCVYCPFITDFEYYRKLKQYYPEWYVKILDTERAMKKGGGAIFKANKVYRLHQILEEENQ